VPPYVIAVTPKLLACVLSNTLELAAVAVIDIGLMLPVAVMAPVCVMLPPELNVKLRPMVEVPMLVAILFVNDTSFVLLFVKDTAPVKTLLLVKVIACAPALKLDAPGTVNTPVCVIAPLVDVIVRFCPTVEAANAVAKVLVSATSFAPLLERVIAPVNPFELFKVIALAPAVKLDVPGAIKAPV